MPPPTLTARCPLGSYFSCKVFSLPPSLSLSLFLFSLSRYSAGFTAPATVFAPFGGMFDAPRVPSFASLFRGWWGGGVAHCSSPGMPQHEKKKCCYQLRGSKKHVHSREASTGHLYGVSVRRL